MLSDNEVITCPCSLGKRNFIQAYKKGETDFQCCSGCGIVFRKKFPSHSELVEIYQDAYAKEKISKRDTNQESGDYATKSYGEFIRNTLYKGNARVLDYGAGSGELVEYLRLKGVCADGLEFSLEAREYCKKKRGFNLLSNLEKIPDGFFHAISMIEVIEHLTDISRTLQELNRVLATGGSLLVTTPNRDGLRARLEKGKWKEAQKKFHLFLFDQKSLFFHLKRAGFTDMQQITYTPLQRKSLKFYLSARSMQLFGMPATLCVVAKK